MKYRLNKGLKEVHTGTDTSHNAPELREGLVEVIPMAEFLKQQKQAHHKLIMRSMENVDHCEAEMYQDSIFGTLCIPDKKNLCEKEWSYAFLMTKDQLLFVGEKVDIAQSMFQELEDYQMVELDSPGQVLFAAIESYLVGDVDFVDAMEKELMKLEDDIAEKTVDYSTETEQILMQKRKELMRLNRYYKQLTQVAEFLADCPVGIISQEEKELFHLLQGKLERLDSDVQEMRDNVNQMKEMYQTKVEMRSNQVMQFLTVVTTVFMPLTLITGWYGMNFANMPELQTAHGYAVIIIICVLIIALEFFIFKKKKWL